MHGPHRSVSHYNDIRSRNITIYRIKKKLIINYYLFIYLHIYILFILLYYYYLLLLLFIKFMKYFRGINLHFGPK